MRPLELILVLVALLALTACAQDPVADPAPEADPAPVSDAEIAEGQNLEAEIVGHTWVLTHIDGEEAAEGSAATTTLAEDGKVEGFGGCNRYFGTYTLLGDTLEVAPLASTKMACPPPLMDLEDRFLERLEAARYLRLDGSELTLTGDEGELVFVLQEEALPEGDSFDSEPA